MRSAKWLVVAMGLGPLLPACGGDAGNPGGSGSTGGAPVTPGGSGAGAGAPDRREASGSGPGASGMPSGSGVGSGAGGDQGGTGAAGPGGGAAPCSPEDVSGFEPTWRPPTGPSQGLCTDAQIRALFDGCLAPTSTRASCDEFIKANTACATCAITDAKAPAQGPIASYRDLGFLDANFAQCVALHGDWSPSGCGAKIGAVKECALAACSADCPVRTDEELVAFNLCAQEAIAGDCLPYAEAAEACSKEILHKGDPVDRCVWDPEKEDYLAYTERMVRLFCGGAGG